MRIFERLKLLMDKIRAIIDAIGFNNFVLLFSGILGAFSYVLKKEMSFWQRLSVIVMGGASSLFLAPLIVYWLDLPNTTQISGGVGYLTGLLCIEVMETVFRVFDEIQKNPKFIIDFITRRFKK
jgi:Na+-transporting NADH:ubiquinone oxidoreductase subunit NqrD